MNQENSENTVESTETNPDEICQDEKKQSEDFAQDSIVESVNEINENKNENENENENQVVENLNQVNKNENQAENNQVIEENQVTENLSQINIENQINDNQLIENEKVIENENQVENSNQIDTENQINENENQLTENENHFNENTNQTDENDCPPVSEPLPETKESPVEQNLESNTDCVSDEKPSEAIPIKLEIQKTDLQPADSSSTPKPSRNQKRHKNPKTVNCDKYGWPIGSKYCTEVNDSSNEVNFTDDVDVINCETKVNVDNQDTSSPDEEILYVVKSPTHRTANTKRTILNVDEVPGAITEGIHAGTHVPHFLNYLSLQVKFKFTLARLLDGKLKITFRFVGKGGESLKDIICLWLQRNDEDKDKIFCEGLTRNKDATLSLLARKFHEIENLKEDIVPLFEEIKNLVPEFRGKEGLRSEDEAFLEGYRNLDNKLLVLLMLLFKENCESDDSKLLSKFRDLYFSLQMGNGFTVKQYLYVIYYYNTIFTPYLPQELEEMVKKYATMKNISLPDSPPLIIPPCGQKSKFVPPPFAKNSNPDENHENTEIPVKTDGTEEPAESKNAPKKRQTNRKNRKPFYKKNNPQNLKSPQGPQNSSIPRNNVRNQFNRFPRNQRDNSFRQSNPRNPNKRQQGNQGGPGAKKRNVNQTNSVDQNLPVDQPTPENSVPNQGNQNKRNRPRTRPRRKNMPNQQNDHPRNNRNPINNPRNLQNNPNLRKNFPRNAQNPRNPRIQNQNLRNEKNPINERNQQRNSRPRRRPDSRKRPDQPRNPGFSSSANNHEFLLNSLRNQNQRNQEMGRNQNFPNGRMFGQSNSNQNFSRDSTIRQNNFPQSNQPLSLFSQPFFNMQRNQNFAGNNSGNQNFSQVNSRRPWSDFSRNPQNFFPGSNNFPNRSRNLAEFSNSNYNSRMSFDDDMHAHNFVNSNNRNWDNNDFNIGKRKNMRGNWNNKRSKQGI